MRFNDNLRSLRREKDYSQEYIAEKMNVSRQTVSKWENGTAMPELKRLTELAELFGVSMDTLLGTEQDENDDKKFDGADYEEYTNQVISYLEAENQAKSNRLIRRLAMLSVLVIIVLIIVVCAMYSTISKNNRRIAELENQINYIATFRQDNSYSDDDDTYVETRIVSVNKEKPNILTVEFKYAPESYPKDGGVYFSIPEKDGESRRVDAENKDGVFTATTEVDVTIDDAYYVFIDDGTNVTKDIIYTSFLSDYLSYQFLQFEVQDDGKNVSLDNTYDEPLYIFSTPDRKIKSAKLVVNVDGGNIYDKPIELLSGDACDDENADYVAHITKINLDVESKKYGIVEAYFQFVDEYGVVMNYYPPISYSPIGVGCLSEDQQERTEYVYNIDGEEITLQLSE